MSLTRPDLELRPHLAEPREVTRFLWAQALRFLSPALDEELINDDGCGVGEMGE